MGHHCQICERVIKDSKGVIAHHGYKRPNPGWQTSSCMGARHLPYEKSRDLIPKAIQQIDGFIQNRANQLVLVKEGTVPVPGMGTYIRSEYRHMPNFIQPGEPFYQIRQREHVSRLESDIKMAARDRDRLQKRYDEWVLVV